MKKIFLTFTISLISIISFANPIYIPPVYLYRFSFDENQKWKIIVAIENTHPDSVLISSSSVKSICNKVTSIPIPTGFGYSIIMRNDSLDSNVNINPEGDSVTIIYYSKSPCTNDTFVYGNYRNSTIPKPLKGQSIERILLINNIRNYYSIFDSSGHDQGILHGHIYDKNNNLITNGSFALSPFPALISCDIGEFYIIDSININNDGTYSTKLYSAIYNINSIDIVKMYVCYCEKIGISIIAPLNFSMYPDSDIELDINLLDTFVNIKKAEVNPTELLKVFPNPLNDNSFHYEISTPVKSTYCFIDLLNINGQEMERYNIFENSGELNLPANISNGTYFLQLRMNDRVYISSRIIVNRK